MSTVKVTSVPGKTTAIELTGNATLEAVLNDANASIKVGGVVVALNGQKVEASDIPSTQVQDGDKITVAQGPKGNQ